MMDLHDVPESGTRWPVPRSWVPSAPGTYRGPTGALSLRLTGGELLDPARCDAAKQTRPADWHLARTRNGTAVTATFQDERVHVLVMIVRADADETTGFSADLPEVHATYTVPATERRILDEVRASLETTRIAPAAYGVLDVYGHAAFGPVPIGPGWSAVDADVVDNTGRLADDLSTTGVLMLVGGGWLMFADAARCCGATLLQKPWRDMTVARVRADLAAAAERRGRRHVLLDSPDARVWSHRIHSPGISYEIRDDAAALCGAGAYWTDVFGQPWRLHYWLDPRHADMVAALEGMS